MKKYRFSFIHTTWDRFSQAQAINDLYSDLDVYVDRIYHTLKNRNPTLSFKQFWDQTVYPNVTPKFHVLRQHTDNDDEYNTQMNEQSHYSDSQHDDEDLLTQLRKHIQECDDLMTINVIPERY